MSLLEQPFINLWVNYVFPEVEVTFLLKAVKVNHLVSFLSNKDKEVMKVIVSRLTCT